MLTHDPSGLRLKKEVDSLMDENLRLQRELKEVKRDRDKAWAEVNRLRRGMMDLMGMKRNENR